LQAEAREVMHLRGQLADKESEVAGLRAHLEEALREELADSDPARLKAAQKRAAALEADLAAKQVLPWSAEASRDRCAVPCLHMCSIGQTFCEWYAVQVQAANLHIPSTLSGACLRQVEVDYLEVMQDQIPAVKACVWSFWLSGTFALPSMRLGSWSGSCQTRLRPRSRS